MSYKIKITKTEKTDWQTTEYQKIADTGNERDNGAIYGYVPVTKKTEKDEEVLSITVDEINLEKVVDAILKKDK